MGNCTGGRSTKPEEIVDLERILIRIAKNRFSTSDLTVAERLCLEKSIYFEVGWNYVKFDHRLVRFRTPLERISTPADFRNVTLFKTKFVNNTKTPQFYTFRTERQTKSTASISVQKGFTLGGNLNIEFSIPSEANAPSGPEIEPSKISGGLSGQLSWSKTRGETHEEVLTWSVDSEVQVEAEKTAWAALVVHEENLDVEFKLAMQESNPEELRPNFLYSDSDPGTVFIITEGTCKAVYGVEQVIQIETRSRWPSDDLLSPTRGLVLGQGVPTSHRGTTGEENEPGRNVTSTSSVVIEEVTEETPLKAVT